MMDIFSDFSGLQLNREKSSFIGFGLSREEMVGCSRILTTDPIPGIASAGSSTTNPGLAAGVGKGGDTTGRMACTPLIAGRSPHTAQGGAVSHPHLFHVHFLDVGGGSTATRDSDVGVLLAPTPSGEG